MPQKDTQNKSCRLFVSSLLHFNMFVRFSSHTFLRFVTQSEGNRVFAWEANLYLVFTCLYNSLDNDGQFLLFVIVRTN